MAVHTEDLPEHLSCPICFEVPDSEVYQCLDGHVLCKKCYFQLSECPQCRTPLDATRPIQNRYFEGLLDSTKVNCDFFPCQTRLARGEIKNHEVLCCYNFVKFGYFVRLCELIGQKDCDLTVNNGNTGEAVQHFVSSHGCQLYEEQTYKMKLEDLNPASNEIRFWTPIISNLKTYQCYIFTMAVLDSKKGSMGWLSFYLPYNGNPNRNKSPVKISFTFCYGNPEEPFTWTCVMTPAPLSKTDFYLPSNIPSPFQLSWLKSHSTLKDSLEIDYKIMAKDGNDKMAYRQVKCVKYSCISNPILPQDEGNVVDWDRLERTPRAEEMYADIKLKLEKNEDRGAVFAFIKEVFEDKVKAGIVNGDIEWLRYGCLFLASQSGTVNAIHYILNKGINCNVMDSHGLTPLHFTMHDQNKKLGLRKAKLLIDQGGADPKRVTFFKQTLLHWAAMHSTPEALKYFIELGLNVNQVDETGRTPLQVLIERRAIPHEEDEFLVKMTKMFLDGGTNCEIKSKINISVYDVAEFKKLEKIQHLIRAYQSVEA